MEEIEVTNLPCNSREKEVVLLDKPNNAKDSADVHEMIVEDSADVHEMVVEESSDVHEMEVEESPNMHEIVAEDSAHEMIIEESAEVHEEISRGSVNEAVAESSTKVNEVVMEGLAEVNKMVTEGSAEVVTESSSEVSEVIVDDSPEVHEVVLEDSAEVLHELAVDNVKEMSENECMHSIDVLEISDEVSSQVDQIVVTDVTVKPKLTYDLKNHVENTVCDNSVLNDSNNSQSSELDNKYIDVMEVTEEEIDKGECSEECAYIEEQEIEFEVVEHENKSNEIEDIDCNTNNINVSVDRSEKSTNNSDKAKEKVGAMTETKNPDGSIVLKRDKMTVTIPQHIAGRDISSLTEETLPRSGKRMLKPRFGVKVPYIHMTSQIVTQDEIAKELFERFQQKYPISRVNVVDSQEKVYAMKLSHQIAKTFSPKPLSNATDKNSEKKIKTNKEFKKKSEKINITNKPKNKSLNTTSIENSPIQIQNLDIEFANNVIEINDSQHIDQITNTLQSLGQSADQHIKSEDKNDEKITSNEELIAILEDFENIETLEPNINNVPEVIPIPKPVVKKKMVRSTTRTKRSKPKMDPEIEKQIALKQLQEVSRPTRFDSHYIKRKAENEKKLSIKNDLGSAQKRKKSTPADVPEVKIAIDHFIKSYTDKRLSTVGKVEDTSNDETVTDNLEVVPPKTEIKTNNLAKARTMREINRLLGDEGAINMIYSLEKRRTPGNNNAKNVLPSTRRKKKDLMLKTKLVKNAMLKMSSPTASSITINRLGRRSDVCTPTISPENQNMCTRKTSIDSQASDQSMKCLQNFPGRNAIPADESKIIRKHSTSSEASSVGDSIPILPVPDAESINNLNKKITPVKALRVYTRKNKNSGDIILNSSDRSFDGVSKETNKSCVKTKNLTSQKIKKQSVQGSKLSKSLAESVKQEVENTVYNEITIRQYDGVVHITLTPVSTFMKNALNISVMKELIKELHNLETDDTCKVVLMSSAGRIFCQGLDIAPLINDNPEKCKEAAVEISSTLKNFITCLSNFPKLLVAGVDGAAVGLGATMLVHFDLVFASDKATFETPYAQLGHIAEGAATTILGRLLVAEMIMGSQRLTAGQAHYYGLVTRTLWPDRFHDELIPLVKALARQSLQAIKTTKTLQKQDTKDKLAKALELETHILVQQWTGDECQQNLQKYLKNTADNINT